VATPVVAVTLTEPVQSMMVAPGISRDVALVAPASAPAPVAPVASVRLPRLAVPAASPAAAAAPPAVQAAASVSGLLRDASGAVLPGVQLTLTNTAAGTSYPGMTDGTGGFAFRNVPAARYELTARLPGFRSITDVVTLNGGDDRQLSLTMQVGGLVETVTVTCGTPAAALPRGVVTPFLAIDRRRVTTRLFALPQAAQLPVRVGGQISAPRQVAHANPTCPGVPPGDGHVVILEATIGVDGTVRDIVSLRPRTADAQSAPFVDAAIDAVRQWQYTPTRLNNVPIPVIMTVTVQFSSK
jgi:hypothetical protein